MSNEEIQKIILAVSKELEINYDKNKIEKYGLASRTLIPFATLRSTSRVARSEGTDEDRDIMICYDKNGWFIYDITVRAGAGVSEVLNESIIKISEEEVAKKYQELNLFEKMNFINMSYEILRISENKSYLF